MKVESKGGMVRGWLLAAAAAALAACGGADAGTGPVDRAPVITVLGVENGGSYAPPLSITIEVDRGTYQATLDGQPWLGAPITQPGEHVLRVTARDGTRTSEREITFQVVSAGTSTLIVRMFDLGDNEAGGGGDAILLSDSAATGIVHVLVDAGPAGAGGGDLGYVARRLAALGVDTLAALVLSHAHSDHFQGMPAVLSGVHVERFVYNGQQRPSYGAYNHLLSQAATAAARVDTLTSLLTLPLSGASDRAVLTLLPPLSTFLQDGGAGGDEINEGSIGGVLRKGPFELFLTGDGEERANQRWRTQYASLSGDVDVLKVGHHGANNAIFDEFSRTSSWLEHTDPEVALISANGVTHPRVAALDRLLSRSNLRTYCTNVHGTITLRVGGDGSYGVTVEKAAADNCRPGTQATT